MIRIAICDDNVNLARETERLTLGLGRSLQQEINVTVFHSAEDFFGHLDEFEDIYDIVIMDIEMGAVSGVEAGRRLRGDLVYDQTLLIYISSYRNYYEELIDLNVFAFIAKPIQEIESNSKLANAIEKVLNRRFISPFPDFMFETKKEKIYVPMKSIMFIESDGRKLNLHTTLRKHSFYGKLDDAEKQLSKDYFCRINRSIIVCFAHIDEISSNSVTISGEVLSISEKYRNATKLAYKYYRGE